MSELAEWLTAILDADERTARAAYTGPWRYNPNKVWNDPPVYGQPQRPGEEYVAAGPTDQPTCIAVTGPADDRQSMDDARHIAQHDPAAVLADIAAKRAILYYHSGNHECSGPDDNCMWITDICPTVRALASAYAHRPGFQDSWTGTGGD